MTQTWGARCEARRNAISTSLDAVGKCAGLSGESVRRAELGRRVRPGTMRAIDDALDHLETVFSQAKAHGHDVATRLVSVQIQIDDQQRQIHALARLVDTLLGPSATSPADAKPSIASDRSATKLRH